LVLLPLFLGGGSPVFPCAGVSYRASLRKFVELVGKGSAEKVTELLEKGADPNFHDDHGDTPATIAAATDDVEMITCLVSGGAHLDFRSKDGLTPVHKAAVCGKSRVLRKMLDLGASPDFRNIDGLTPL
jgi:SH3/ankyrin repeat-containing protein